MRTILLILLIAVSSSLFAQVATDNNYNLILIVDDEIFTNHTTIDIQLNTDSESVNLKANYLPGNLRFLPSDYEQFINSESSTVNFTFSFIEGIDGKEKKRSYTITLNTSLIKDTSFFIIRFYNLDKRENRRIFSGLEKDQEYLYEFIYSGGARLYPRNKSIYMR